MASQNTEVLVATVSTFIQDVIMDDAEEEDELTQLIISICLAYVNRKNPSGMAGISHLAQISPVAVFYACVLGVVCTLFVYNTVLQSGNSDHWSMFGGNHEATYRHRRKTLLEACKDRHSAYRGMGNVEKRLEVDDKHKLVYCPIAKVASSFWRRVIQVSSGTKPGYSPYDVANPHDNSVPTLTRYTFGTAFMILNRYTSFLFVREPYSRLLSCYVDKFFTVNTLFWDIGKEIIRRHRLNTTALVLSCGNDVTFPEFIKHVIDTVQTKKGLNMHWMPMYMVCEPCEIDYDVIGKLETISQDFDYILKTHIRDDVIFTDMESESEVNRLVGNLRGVFRRFTAAAQKCLTLREMIYRFVQKQKIQGFLTKSVEIPDWINKSEPGSRKEVEKFILEKYREDGDKTLRKLNRKEALVEAYSQVPLEDMLKLQQLYKPDFDIFGYDPQPPELFGENIRNGKVKKFYFVNKKS